MNQAYNPTEQKKEFNIGAFMEMYSPKIAVGVNFLIKNYGIKDYTQTAGHIVKYGFDNVHEMIKVAKDQVDAYKKQDISIDLTISMMEKKGVKDAFELMHFCVQNEIDANSTMDMILNDKLDSQQLKNAGPVLGYHLAYTLAQENVLRKVDNDIVEFREELEDPEKYEPLLEELMDEGYRVKPAYNVKGGEKKIVLFSQEFMDSLDSTETELIDSIGIADIVRLNSFITDNKGIINRVEPRSSENEDEVSFYLVRPTYNSFESLTNGMIEPYEIEEFFEEPIGSDDASTFDPVSYVRSQVNILGDKKLLRSLARRRFQEISK